MAAFQDLGTLGRAVRAGAVPTLEALEANPALLGRERLRFDCELPPAYTSSTDGESEPDPERISDAEILRILDEPLTDKELDKVGRIAVELYCAGSRVWAEYQTELEYLEKFCCVPGPDPPLTSLLKYRIHQQRLHILARSAVRRRWQALGVWNDGWGAVIRNRENASTRGATCAHDEDGNPWEWEWAGKDMPPDRTHPAFRAVLLRAGLRREECPVLPPRSNPSGSSSVGEKDSFITSRPWFQFLISCNEETQRIMRLSFEQFQRANLPHCMQSIIRSRWERNGLWKPEWDKQRLEDSAGWNWPHESSSPEPEVYTRIDPDALEEHLSPSELDEYERIVPSPPNTPPEKLWPLWHKKGQMEVEKLKFLETPPKYSKTAAKPKPTTRRAPPRRRQPATKVKESTRGRTPSPHRQPTRKPQKPMQNAVASAGLRRSPRIAALQDKKQKELADKEKQDRPAQTAKTTRRARGAAAVKKGPPKTPRTPAKGTKRKRK